MYNRYPRGSEPWYAMQDAIEAAQAVEDGRNAVEDVLERVIEELDTAIGEKEEAEQELDLAQKERDEAMATIEAMDLAELITLLTNIKVAGEAINRYVTDKLVALGALNASTDSDSDSGDPGDGGGEATDHQAAGSEAAAGITRPQIP